VGGYPHVKMRKRGKLRVKIRKDFKASTQSFLFLSRGILDNQKPCYRSCRYERAISLGTHGLLNSEIN